MSKYPKTSVVDIAMGILENMDPKKSSIQLEGTSNKVTENKDKGVVSDYVPDITKTDVSDNYVDNILQESLGVKVNRKPELVNKKITVENKLTDLVNKLSSLLNEAKQVLKEMDMPLTPAATKVGSIGVKLVGKNKRLKK